MSPQAKSIPFFDLKKQNKHLQSKFEAVFRRLVTRADFVLGAEVENFEKNFARFVGTRFAVGVNSGQDALALSLRVLKIGPGDEVIVPANSFVATAFAVTSVGALPVFVDAEPENLLIDLKCVQRVLSKRTKAIIPVHLYGQAVPMAPLLDLCRRKGLHLVEDACQAHGASIGKKRCGSFGDFGCFSFYPSKNLGAFGEGGMVTTNNRSFYEELRLWRSCGSVVKFQHEVPGYNSRLDALQAAVLNIKLRYLPSWNKKRTLLAERYDSFLKEFKSIQLLKRRKNFLDVHHLYVARLDRRDALRTYLAQKGIGTSVHYTTPIYRQRAYADLRKKPRALPVCEEASKRVISLPMYPEMPLENVDRVCLAIREFLRSK